MRRGFTLIESLISLVVMSILMLAAFESFGAARRVFAGLQDVQANRMSALAVLEKIRSDALVAGRGLGSAARLGLVEGIEETEDGYVWIDAEAEMSIGSDLAAGQRTIAASGAADFTAGRSVCLHDGRKGEKAVVQSADSSGLVLTSPLAFDYPGGETTILLLRSVSIYLDARSGVLRRRVNTASAQPLLEGVAGYFFKFERGTSLAVVGFRMDGDGGRTYELSMVAKNLAMAHVKAPA